MRVYLAILIPFIFLNSLFAQKQNDSIQDSANKPVSKVKILLDSVTESMITDYYKEDYSTVILKANEILKLAKDNDFPIETIRIHSYLANSYYHLNDSVKSLEYAEANIKIANQLKTTKPIIGTQIDLGNIYVSFGKFDEALKAFRKVIPLAEKENEKLSLFILNYNITEIFLVQLKDHERAKPYLEAAKKYVSKDFKMGITGLHLFKAHYAFQTEDYNLASTLYQETIVLAKESNYTDVLRKGYHGYIDCLVKKEDYKKAYEVRKIEDSLSYAQKQKDIEKSAKILTANLKNTQIQEELKNQALTDELIIEKADKRNNFLIASVIVSLLLLALVLNLLKVVNNRKKLNALLKKKNKDYLDAKLESEKLAKAKSRFLSTMSHELRTPLYGIIGLSTILNNDKNLKSHKTELQSLKFSADYLLNLVNDVLTLNKMDSNEKNEIESKSFHLKDFLYNIKESLEYITGQTDNNLIITLDSKIPNWIKGDQTKISQVLINLLGNALKFTDHGEVKLIANLIESTEDHLKIKFEVKDNGVGISENDQRKIFEEFGQLNHQSLFQGSGLGLTIVQKLLVEMKSSIQLESAVGKGSNFFFEMTFGIATEEHINQDKEDTSIIDILRGKKILVVDDNTINLLVTKKTLESHDIQADIASNGQEGIDKIIESDYDLVLMDVFMPKMDGIEATKRIRKLGKTVTIIALTAVTQNEQDDHFKSAKFDDSIVKPYKVNDFLKTIAANISKD